MGHPLPEVLKQVNDVNTAAFLCSSVRSASGMCESLGGFVHLLSEIELLLQLGGPVGIQTRISRQT